MTSPFCDKNLTSWPESIKEIIKKARSNRYSALELLNTSKQTSEDYHYPNLNFINDYGTFFIDGDSCYCSIGTEKPDNPNIKIDTEFKESDIGNKIVIISTWQKEFPFILKKIENVPKLQFLSMRIKTYGKSLSPFMANIIGSLNKNCDENHNVLIAYGDQFTNEICINLILNQISEHNENTNLVYLYDAFYCKNGKKFNEFKITDFVDKNVSKYLEEQKNNPNFGNILFMLCKQVLRILTILKINEYGFVHGNLKCSTVYVKIKKDEDPVFKIGDFKKSSVFWHGVRFCNPMIDLLDKIYEGIPVKTDEDLDLYYKLPLKPEIYIASWIPFHMTYDIYTFFYSLMLEPSVWNYFTKESNNKDEFFLEKALRFLFPYEYEKMLSQLQKLHLDVNSLKITGDQLRSMATINNNLRQFKLRWSLVSLEKIFDIKSESIESKPTEKIQELAGKKYKLSKGHICTSECTKNHSCVTNKYHFLNQVKSTDQCK